MKKKALTESPSQSLSTDGNWLQEELSGAQFPDARLTKRFHSVAEQLWSGLGQSIPFACRDWANTKAAYRFLSNEDVNESDILSGHFRSTKERFSSLKEYCLVLQDTTEFSYTREQPEDIGIINRFKTDQLDLFGKPIYRTDCGLLMHSSLVVSRSGIPLGLAATKFWTREKFKGTNALKRHTNPTRIPIEQKESYRWLENLRQSTALLGDPQRCIHVGDRESDIYELFHLAGELGTNFLVRTCVNRLAVDGSTTINEEMEKLKPKKHVVSVDTHKGRSITADLEVRYKKMTVCPPIGKGKRYVPLVLTVIHAREINCPVDRPKIDWRLITNLSIESHSEAIEKLDWYALRWRIETFHKILKSCCKSENLKLRSAQRLTNAISIFCILSWRLFWATMVSRQVKNAAPDDVFTADEIHVLDEHFKDAKRDHGCNLNGYLRRVAILGGHLDRKSDPPPGNLIMWRGFQRLADMILGYEAAINVGN